MAKFRVTFEPVHRTVEIDPSECSCTREGEPGSVLDIALSAGVHIEHVCGGEGVCGTCHVIVNKGMEYLSEATDEELDVVEQVPGNTPESRLACRAVVGGDVTVTIPEWNRNLVSEAPE
ncbi:MAG: 2Fe-2S iron-sulfur cluster binding domain-containing protein [Phycisphaerae bacterium]|nr:2Fe-2S iron-sulfur cluster binding domain-containing protein [Phycisphaerae bacterium]